MKTPPGVYEEKSNDFFIDSLDHFNKFSMVFLSDKLSLITKQSKVNISAFPPLAISRPEYNLYDVDSYFGY